MFNINFFKKMTKKSFFKRSLKGVAIAICLAGMVMFSGCKEDGSDNGLGWIKYDGETYYLRETPDFWGGINECDEYFIDEQNPFGGWKVHQWWFQYYRVYAAKSKKGVYATINLCVVNSDFSAPMGTFSNITKSNYESGCPNNLEKGVVCDGTTQWSGCHFGYPTIEVDSNSADGIVYDDIVSGSVEVKPTNNGCEVKGKFTTKKGKTVEISYRGILKK